MFNKELGIIGIGNMGTALLRGIINSQIIEFEKIIIYDIDSKRLEDCCKEFKVQKAISNNSLTKLAKYILIAVKPQVIEKVLKEIGEIITEDQIIISIAAGISIDYINKYLKQSIGIVRVMPNTPALVGAGASALACNEKINDDDLNYVKKLLPDSIGNLTDVLPSLQAGEALIIGDAVVMPTLIYFDECAEYWPSSNDVKYYDIWKEQ